MRQIADGFGCDLLTTHRQRMAMMSATLRDPNLPPGAIVVSRGDGTARRNDGVELKPAATNPWYVLATVAGEQEGDWFSSPDIDLHAENRRYWNAWMCQDLDESARDTLAKALNLSAEELGPLLDSEVKRIQARFEQIWPNMTIEEIIPDGNSTIDLSSLHFKNPFVFSCLYIRKTISFEKSVFEKEAIFPLAFFCESAIFSNTYFVRDAGFERAFFGKNTFFENVYFAEDAYFMNTEFKADANFYGVRFSHYSCFVGARFKSRAVFASALFCRKADFKTAQFSETIDFTDGEFRGATIFKNTEFLIRVPEFYHFKMHQNTMFTDDRSLWPAVTDMNAASDKQAYTRLRQIAAGNHNPDLEHFFLRQEMRCKQHLAQRFDKLFFKAYALFSDYGISVARPVAGLALVTIVGALVIGWHLWVPEQEWGEIIALRQGLGISLGNILPFLGIVPRIFPEFHASAPWWLNTMAVFQSFAGIVFLFFLGLGLRNRFRLR